MKRRPPREVVWRVMVHGPAAMMLIIAVGLVIWTGWGQAWDTALAYTIAAANMWLASRQLLGNYRSGYYHGRLDLLLERMGVQPERGRDNQPGPWDDPTSEETMARMRQIVERGDGDADPA